MIAHRIAIILTLILIFSGCTSKRGIIEIHTKPPGADVYMDHALKGKSPLSLEYDFTTPATLKILKEGYYSEIEALCQAWVVREIRKGNYAEGKFVIQGERTSSWKVTTSRRLQKKDEE